MGCGAVRCWPMGSCSAKWVDHQSDGDRDERSLNARARAGEHLRKVLDGTQALEFRRGTEDEERYGRIELVPRSPRARYRSALFGDSLDEFVAVTGAITTNTPFGCCARDVASHEGWRTA